jgi:predicted amidohydrolase YtcJ
VYGYLLNNYWHTNYKADQPGPLTSRFVLRPHGPFDAVALRKFSATHEQPLLARPIRRGDPAVTPPFTLTGAGVIVDALRPAPDGRGILVRLYNAAGTTSVFEGHGVAPQLMTAYQRLHDTGRATTRAHLVFSPGWSRLSPQDLKSVVASWGTWLAGRGLGSDWLRVGGIYTEIDDAPEGRLRARCAPQTGWAGFSYDTGLPRAAVKDLMLEAARLGIRVCGIWADLLELYAEVDRSVPIAGQRWVLGHQSILGAKDIALMRDLGVVVTAHTNAHIYHRASEFLAKVGRERENEICPLRSLLDAGVPVSLCTDNMPISMFHPIWESVERIDRKSDRKSVV